MFQVKVLYDMDKGEVNFNTPSPESGYYASSPDSAVTMSPEYTGNMQQTSYGDFRGNNYIPGVSLIATKTPQTFFRFRYESEMHGTHGSLMGKDSTREVKTFPTVQLMGVETLKNNPTVRIRCTLYQADRHNDEIPHSHKLVIKSGDQERYDPHFMDGNAHNRYTVEFKGMGIIHTAKKDIVKELGRKLIRMKEFELERELTPFEVEREMTKVSKVNVKSMNLNQVCLCFEAFCYDHLRNQWMKICPAIFSEPINNIKSALTGELKICNYSTCVSPASGGQEVYLLVEKVNRSDIKVRFFDNDGWQDFARIDTVHHQFAIVMRTPPYKDQSITGPVQVFFQLYRTKDGCMSMAREFTYKPNDIAEMPGQKRKMRRMEENIIPTTVEPVSSTTTSASVYEDNDQDIERIDFEGFNLNFPLSPEENHMVNLIRQELELESSSMTGGSPQSQIEYDSVPEEPKIIGKGQDLHELLVRLIKNGDEESFGNVLTLIKTHNSLQKMLQIRHGVKRMTLIHLCCVYGRSTYLPRLIDSKTDLNIVNTDGNNVIHLCIEANQMACLKVLLTHKNKISTETKNYDGWTPLHFAVKNNSLPFVKILVENGGNFLNLRRSQTFETVLHTAVEIKSPEMVNYILRNTGTQLLNKLNGSDKTPLDILYDISETFDTKQQEIASLLLDNGGYSQYINASEIENGNNEDYEYREEEEDEQEPINEIEQTLNELSLDHELSPKIAENPIKFDKIGKNELCLVLNATQAWRQCATLLDLENLCDMWGRQDNPSECLLAYIEGCKFELQSVIDTLQTLQLTEAICAVDGMLARQLS